MLRNYRHIQEYEREIIELRSEGYTGKEIQAKIGLSEKQYGSVKSFAQIGLQTLA